MNLIQDVVTFDADGALYAVPVGRVQEILDLRPTAAMPNAPAHLLGIIDLRGANIPVVDLRRLLGRPDTEDTHQSRILVVAIRQNDYEAVIGVKTDRVIEVTLLDNGEMKPLDEEEMLRWAGSPLMGISLLDNGEMKPLDEAEMLRWAGSPLMGIGRCKGQMVSVIDLDRLFARVDLAVTEDAA